MGNEYVVENHRIRHHIEHAENLLERKLSDWEKQIFEWAYIQGKEDGKERK